MYSIMLSCKKVCELIDKQSVIKLSSKEKTMLHMHTSMCRACKACKKQSSILNEFLIKNIRSTSETHVPQTINNDFKQQIISKL